LLNKEGAQNGKKLAPRASSGPQRREKSPRVSKRRLNEATTPQVQYTILGNLTAMVLSKFVEEMDPILCSKHLNRCWLRVGGSPSDSEYGATLFPFIQNYDQQCLSCVGENAKAESCNDLDFEYQFYFDAAIPGSPTYFDYNRTDYVHYNLAGTGMSGLLSVNLYYGVNYLTKGFYELPNTHCSTPIAIAVSATSSLACGSKTSKHLIKHGKQKKKYCSSLPVPPQEIFYECRKGVLDIAFESLGTAYGTAATAGSFLTIALMLIATWILRLKPDDNFEIQRKSTHIDLLKSVDSVRSIDRI